MSTLQKPPLLQFRYDNIYPQTSLQTRMHYNISNFTRFYQTRPIKKSTLKTLLQRGPECLNRVVADAGTKMSITAARDTRI